MIMGKLGFIFCCVLVISLEICAGLSLSVYSNAENHPLEEFSHHTLVIPKLYHRKKNKEISTTKQEDGQHAEYLQVTFENDGQNFTLDLNLNKGLIAQGFFQEHQENGKYEIHKPTAQEADLCHYKGTIRGKPMSWVALSTCNGLSGVIFDGTELYYIEKRSTLNEFRIENPHFLYKHSNLLDTKTKSCGYDGNMTNQVHNHWFKYIDILRNKRDTESSRKIRGPYNANRDSRYVELVLIFDNQEYKELRESKAKVLDRAKTIANIVNGIYTSLNIFIALVGVVIWSENDEIQFSKDGDTTLGNFLRYRRETLLKTHPNDNAQLITKFKFNNAVIGKALKGPICTYEYSGGVSADISPLPGLVAVSVAHMLGHNFGMEHDTTECQCSDERCIMSSSFSSTPPINWSNCSKNYLLQAFSRGMDYCLKNKPVSLFDSPICGNGFVESSEECDCGLPENCDSNCCNATTCMLHSNATCATGECCNLKTCSPRDNGTICRSADVECDLPEYCDGQSEYCPDDFYKIDGGFCQEGEAYCYKGSCKTRTDQCKLLWGKNGLSVDICYDKLNTKGTRYGNCGYDQVTKTFYKCADKDVQCGLLQCKHSNETLEFGMESVAILSHTYLQNKGEIVSCMTAIVDLGLDQINPGMVPNGAPCGDGKMCVNQKCVSISSFRAKGS